MKKSHLAGALQDDIAFLDKQLGLSGEMIVKENLEDRHHYDVISTRESDLCDPFDLRARMPDGAQLGFYQVKTTSGINSRSTFHATRDYCKRLQQAMQQQHDDQPVSRFFFAFVAHAIEVIAYHEITEWVEWKPGRLSAGVTFTITDGDTHPIAFPTCKRLNGMARRRADLSTKLDRELASDQLDFYWPE